jgi:dihydrofolate reductase
MPDEEVHAAANELEQSIGTLLYGRRLYETMAVWETMDDPDPVMQEFAAAWRDSDKIVYSRTLESAHTSNTRIEHVFDPDAVRAMKASADRDLSVGGAGLAAEAWRAGLVDECHLFLVPVMVGGGKRALPDGVRTDLRLLDQRRFESGFVYLRYAVR